MGLHQRLIIVLGHPTLSFSVVLFSMLIGTGLGAAASSRLFPKGQLRDAGLVILVTLVAVVLCVPLIRHLDRANSSLVRILAAAIVVTPIGFVLGFAFPLGIRRVAGTAESATQKMWALNGAASIAGSILAAIVGFTHGSTAVLMSGLALYAVATMAGTLADRVRHGSGA
jgi:hypothetical protein